MVRQNQEDARRTASEAAAPQRAEARHPRAAPSSQRRQLQQIIAGLAEGVILVDAHRTILWANDAALRMHEVTQASEIGRTTDDYRARFKLRLRNGKRTVRGTAAIDRVLSGKASSDALIEVTPRRGRRPAWVHQVRTLVLTDEADRPDCLVLMLSDVTERLEAETRFEASFAVNPAPAILCRLHDLLLIKANKGFLQLTGYPAGRILGKRFTEIEMLDGLEDPNSLQRRLIEGEPLGQTEARLRVAGGGDKPVIIAGQPIEFSDQRAIMFTFSDLEPRRAAEQALREAQARAKAYFEALYAQAPVALYSLDAERKVVSVSDRWLELLGYARDEVIGRPIGHFLPGREAAAAFARDWDRLLAEGVVHDLGHRFVKRSGAVVDVLLSARAEREPGGSEQRTVAALFDISERRRLEERFRKLFELAPVPMAVIELDGGRVVSLNQALLTCIGRSADEISGPGAGEVHLREIVEDGARVEQSLAQGQPVRNLETRLACLPGGVLDCLVSAETVSVGGRSHGLVVMQDITDRRRSEAQLFEALETVMRDTSWFSRSVIERLNHLRRPAAEPAAPIEDLTVREREILALMSTGLGNAEIAARLQLSPSTVRNHVGAIYGKLDVHSRAAAIIWARERGVLAAGPGAASGGASGPGQARTPGGNSGGAAAGAPGPAAAGQARARRTASHARPKT